jgi:hypothetical protein
MAIFHGRFDFRDMSSLVRKTVGLVALALMVGGTQHLSAATIYNNSVHDLTNRFNPGPFQVGNEITFASTERLLTNFSFEFWGTNTASPGNTTFAGSVHAEVRFYLNDGTNFNGYATPGTMFYDSGLFAVTSPTARSTFVFTGQDDFGGGLLIPGDSITWTVQFFGMGGTDSLGLDLYSPPTVGSNFSDYWENQGSGWALKTNSLSSSMSFGSRFDATVPEPSSITLSILGGVGLFLVFGRMRRKH